MPRRRNNYSRKRLPPGQKDLLHYCRPLGGCRKKCNMTRPSLFPGLPRLWAPLGEVRGRDAWVTSDIVDDYIVVLNRAASVREGRVFVVSPYFSAVAFARDKYGKYVPPGDRLVQFFLSDHEAGPRCPFFSSALNYIVIPVNVDNAHWVLCVFVRTVSRCGNANLLVHRIVYRDSLPSGREKREDDVCRRISECFGYVLRRAHALMIEEGRTTFGRWFRGSPPCCVVPLLNIFPREDCVPFALSPFEQDNGCDCGVWVLLWMRELVAECHFPFSPGVRRENARIFIASELAHSRLHSLAEIVSASEPLPFEDSSRDYHPPIPGTYLSRLPETRLARLPENRVAGVPMQPRGARYAGYYRSVLYKETRPKPQEAVGYQGPPGPPLTEIFREGAQIPETFNIRLPPGLRGPPSSVRFVWDNLDGTRTVLLWRLDDHYEHVHEFHRPLRGH